MMKAKETTRIEEANANERRKKERTEETEQKKRKPMSGQVETLYLCMCDKDIWANYVIAISGTRVDGKREHNIKTFVHAPKQTSERFSLLPTSLNPSRCESADNSGQQKVCKRNGGEREREKKNAKRLERKVDELTRQSVRC